MKLDELKLIWQQESEEKSEQQLRTIMKQHVNTAFAKIKLRVVLESAAFLLALLVFFTGLDPHRNVAWVNVLFALALLIGIANNGILYRRITINAEGASLIALLKHIHRQLQWQIGFAIAFSVLLFTSVFAFLLLRVALTDQKLLMMCLVLPASIGIRTWVEVRHWQRNVGVVRHCLAELTGK